jgi:hypothetical protein
MSKQDKINVSIPIEFDKEGFSRLIQNRCDSLYPDDRMRPGRSEFFCQIMVRPVSMEWNFSKITGEITI